MRGSRGEQGSRPPLKSNKNIGFPSNTGLDPLKITKLPSQKVGPPLTKFSGPARVKLRSIQYDVAVDTFTCKSAVN